MEYIELEDERLSIHGSFNADFQDNYTIETILQEGRKTEQFEELEKTSRSMWPKHETVGITYEGDDFEIDIRHNSVRIRLDNVFDFDSVYDEVQTILHHTNIEIPSKEQFKTGMISMYSELDEYWITYDETKCEPSQEFQTSCRLETEHIDCTYSHMQGIVTFSLGEHLNYKEITKTVEKILDKDIIVINTEEEIEKLNQSFEGRFD